MDQELSKLVNFCLTEIRNTLINEYIAVQSKPKYTGWKRFLLDMGMDECKVLEEKRRVIEHTKYNVTANRSSGRAISGIDHILDKLEEMGYNRRAIKNELFSIHDRYNWDYSRIEKLSYDEMNRFINNIINDARVVFESLPELKRKYLSK